MLIYMCFRLFHQVILTGMIQAVLKPPNMEVLHGPVYLLKAGKRL